MVFARTLVFAVVAGAVEGHGSLTIPAARQGSNLWCNVSGWPGCNESVASWFNPDAHTTGETTIIDPKLLTVPNPYGHECCQDFPWRAPGTASGTLATPCGKNIGTGEVGTKLPPTHRTVLKRGQNMEVSWLIVANHGGGYNYRLCKFGPPETLTEECFQATPLAFVGNSSWLFTPPPEDSNLTLADGKRVEIPAIRTSIGTTPPGSVWTKNPIPITAEFFPPPLPGLIDNAPSSRQMSIMDKVQIPSNLEPGDYVLSWRWDCEMTPQVWTNCADLTIE